MAIFKASDDNLHSLQHACKYNKLGHLHCTKRGQPSEMLLMLSRAFALVLKGEKASSCTSLPKRAKSAIASITCGRLEPTSSMSVHRNNAYPEACSKRTNNTWNGADMTMVGLSQAPFFLEWRSKQSITLVYYPISAEIWANVLNACMLHLEQRGKHRGIGGAALTMLSKWQTRADNVTTSRDHLDFRDGRAIENGSLVKPFRKIYG